MVIIFGAIVIVVCVLVGFTMVDGKISSLIHVNEFLVIGGASIGSMIIMAPWNVLKDLGKKLFAVLKGIPYRQKSYEDLFQALYELFMIGRKNGMIALEDQFPSCHILGEAPLN